MDLGVASNHRLGGPACKPPPLDKKNRRTIPERIGARPAVTEEEAQMEVEDLPPFDVVRPSPSPPPAAVCAASSEAALGGPVAGAGGTREMKRADSPLGWEEDEEEEEEEGIEESPLPRRLSPREKLRLRLGLCNPEEQREWMAGRPAEEIARLQRDPDEEDLRMAKAWGFLDVFDSNGKFVRVASVEDKRTELFQQWRHRCREAIKSLSPKEKEDRSSPVSTERPDPKVSGRRGGESGDGSYLGLRSGFLSSGSSGKGGRGSSGSGEKSRSQSPLSPIKGDGRTLGGRARKSAPRRSSPKA